MTEQMTFLCAGGFRAALDLIAPEFERAHHVSLAVSYATPGRTREILEEGFRFDAGVIVAGVLKKAQSDGLAREVTQFKLAVSPVGVGVRAGRDAPDVSTLEAFRAALATIDTLGLSDPKAGTQLGAETLAHAERLGLADDFAAKLRWIDGPGSHVSAAVARGDIDAVITLASEIKPIPGVAYAGKAPPELQTEYAMQALAPAQPSAPAQALLDFLKAPRAQDMMRSIGLEPLA